MRVNTVFLRRSLAATRRLRYRHHIDYAHVTNAVVIIYHIDTVANNHAIVSIVTVTPSVNSLIGAGSPSVINTMPGRADYWMNNSQLRRCRHVDFSSLSLIMSFRQFHCLHTLSRCGQAAILLASI